MGGRRPHAPGLRLLVWLLRVEGRGATLNEEELQRYSRHLLLPEVDVEGQQRLSGATALLIGAGGLGSPVAMYLAASGVGHLIISDDDHVDLGNLQRQVLHGTPDVGRLKTESARDRLGTLNPLVRVSTLPRRLNPAELEREAGRADVTIDASDNFGTRFALDAACIAARAPLVWGAAARMQGQVSCFDHRRADSPCLRCLYPDDDAPDRAADCAAGGVLAPLTGIIGSVMATAALKILLGLGDTLCGRLLRFDASNMTWREASLPRDPACPSCGDGRLPGRANAR